MFEPARDCESGATVKLAAEQSALMIGREDELFVLKFSCDVLAFFQAHGQIPLPPYIDRSAEHADRERYQTVYARSLGAVAAPTAGLHFDDAIFADLQSRRIGHAFVTLHVGAGTFAPMRSDDIDQHQMHSEYLEVPLRTCEAIRCRAGRGRPGDSGGHNRGQKPGDGGRRRSADADTNSALPGQHPHIHQTWLHLSRGRCHGHEFPPAGVDPADAVFGLCRARGVAGRLRARGARALPIFQLR